MDIETKVKTALLIRGFDNEKMLNNRGLIGATIDETVLAVVKNLGIANVSQQSELLLQCYKEGFQAAVDSLVGANEAVKNKTLQ